MQICPSHEVTKFCKIKLLENLNLFEKIEFNSTSSSLFALMNAALEQETFKLNFEFKISRLHLEYLSESLRKSRFTRPRYSEYRYFALTDTSEDSKVVDRRICAKVSTPISTAFERRV